MSVEVLGNAVKTKHNDNKKQYQNVRKYSIFLKLLVRSYKTETSFDLN